MSAQGAQAATVQEISGGDHGQTYMGGQFGQYIGTQVNKTYNPVGVSGKPHKEGEFQVGCLITVHENCPISLSSRIFNATLHSGVTGDKKAAVKITAAEKKNYREAKVHFSVPHHKNIVERIATDTFNFRGQPSIFIAMELCDCNLYDHVQSEKKDNIPFDVEKYTWFAYQILQGLAFLHLYQVVHGDLKPPNVLLKGNIIKLSDFGLSKPITSGKDLTVLTSPQAGTLGWQAPEVLKGAVEISTATDIFPAGLVLYFVFSHGEHAYGVELYSLSHNIANGINQNLSKMQIPNSYIAELLVRQMLESDPANRPSAKQALENKIFNSFGSKPPKVTDSRLHEIVNNAVEDLQSRPSQVRKNQSINDTEEVIPLGVTLAQLFNAMNVIFEEKKISVSEQKKATDTELQEFVGRAVKQLDGQGRKLTNNEEMETDEKTSLSFTVDQLVNALKQFRLVQKPSELLTSEEEEDELGEQAAGLDRKTEYSQGKKTKIQILIKMSGGKVINLKIKDSYTVGRIKHKIDYREGIPPSEQSLYFNDVLLDNDHTLRQYNIKNKSIISLTRLKFQIFILMMTGKKFALDVSPSDTIESVKKQIEDKEGIVEQKRLICGERILEDDHKLSYYDIEEYSTLHLVLQLRA